jgi:predicted P-loop ATPase
MDFTPLKALSAKGYTLIPLNGKIPATREWTKAHKGDFTPESLEKRGGNYGVALSASDLVIDVDPRHFEKGDKPLARLVKAVGGLPKSFTVRTGGGGLHLYLKKPPECLIAHTLKEYPGLEFKTKGRQVVGPGSIHPESKKVYEVMVDAPISFAPAALLEIIKTTAVPFAEIEKGEMRNETFNDSSSAQGRYVAYLEDVAPISVEGKQGDATAFAVACCGRDFGLSPAITISLLCEFWNPRCCPPWEDAELEAKVINAYKYAKKEAGNKDAALDFDKLKKEPPLPPKEEIVWQLTKNGQVVKCFYNLLNYLKLPGGGLHHVFGFNEFTGQVEFTNPAPWHKGQLPRSLMVEDCDLKLLKGYLAVKHGFEMTTGAIEEAIAVVGRDNAFHPVREYLNGLVWDSKKRIDTWLSDFAGVQDSAYVRSVGRKVLCAAVTRILKPGCKFDHIMVLEGEQGIGKSRLCRILGGTWAADFTLDPHNKDTIQNLQGKWIVEMAEMAVVNRSEQQALKAFITRQSDKIRVAYGRLSTEFQRQCIFIGTINPEADGTYLKDSTGNRRFWPVELVGGRVNFTGLAENRNQLFAEAAVLAKAGEKLYMETGRMEEDARAVADARHAEDPWTERIAQWLTDPVAGLGSGKGREFITAREIFVDAMGGIDKQLGRRDVVSIANVLRRLGWKSVLKWKDGRPVRGYVRASSVVEKREERGTETETENELDGLI